MKMKEKYAAIFTIYIGLVCILVLIESWLGRQGVFILPQIKIALHCLYFIGLSFLVFRGAVQALRKIEQEERAGHKIKSVVIGLFYIYFIILFIVSFSLVIKSDGAVPGAEDTAGTEQEKYSTEYTYERGEETRKRGFKAIYDEFFADGNYIYEIDYDAKGYSRLIVYEDDSRVECLVYDIVSYGQQSGKFIHYSMAKSETGSWSIMDGEYINTYFYDYENHIAYMGK